MSRIARFTGPGKPLVIEDRPLPEPGPGEALVEVIACMLCASDLHTHSGRRTGPTPCILGHEIVGRVVACGPEQSAPVGQRVTWSVCASCQQCERCLLEIPQKCTRLFKYGHQPEVDPFAGGLADHVLLRPGSAITPVPDAIPDLVAASANCSTATVAGMIRAVGTPLLGKRVLILGAGVLGLTATAMARHAGASAVVVRDPIPEQRERALRFGATAVEADGKGEADVVFELAGRASAVEAALRSAAIGGTIVLAGTVSPTPGVTFDPEWIVRRLLTIRGAHNYAPQDLRAALDFLAKIDLRPFEELITAVFPLSEVNEAFAHAHRSPGRRVGVVPRS